MVGVRQLGTGGAVAVRVESRSPFTRAPREPYRSNLEPVVICTAHEQMRGNAPAQRDEKPRVRGANSFSQVPVRGGGFAADVAQQIGRRLLRLTALDTASNSGPWFAAADRVPVAIVPGGSFKDGVEFTRPDGVCTRGPRAMKNAAAWRGAFRRQFGERSVEPDAADKLAAGAERFAQQYSAMIGFARCLSRLPRVRVPRG